MTRYSTSNRKKPARIVGVATGVAVMAILALSTAPASVADDSTVTSDVVTDDTLPDTLLMPPPLTGPKWKGNGYKPAYLVWDPEPKSAGGGTHHLSASDWEKVAYPGKFVVAPST